MFLACASHEQCSSYMETHVGSVINSLFPCRRPCLHILNMCDEPIKKSSGSYNKETEEETETLQTQSFSREIYIVIKLYIFELVLVGVDSLWSLAQNILLAVTELEIIMPKCYL